MKKALLVVFCILMFGVSSAFAAPFVVSDPNPGVEKIILEINGQNTPEFAAQADGSVRYDIAGLAEGMFIIRAKAGNVWGWSEWSLPLSDTKAIPEAPGSLRVSSE